MFFSNFFIALKTLIKLLVSRNALRNSNLLLKLSIGHTS